MRSYPYPDRIAVLCVGVGLAGMLNACSKPAGRVEAPTSSMVVKPSSPAEAKPSTPPDPSNQVAALRGELARSGLIYKKRLELRRSLMQSLRKLESLDQLEAELSDQLADVENSEGSNKAQRVALAEANTFQVQKDFRAAAAAFDVMLRRYPEGRFTAEGLHQRGMCLLEQRAYASAAEAWQRLVERHDDSPHAPLAWRKLALAQALQAKFEESMATLEVMAAKYNGTEHAEYARMRRAYVLAAAGRTSEAKTAYDTFLKDSPQSKYCLLVRRQIASLEQNANLLVDPKGQ